MGREVKVLDEYETIHHAYSMSVARYGDGELRLATGSNSISQRQRSPELQRELREILANPIPNLLVCIPRIDKDLPQHKQGSWSRYSIPLYSDLYKLDQYGSAFITRPDSAPQIDRPEFWYAVKRLWSDRNICLVRGDDHSLLPELMPEAASIREVMGLHTESYQIIDDLERQIGATDETVILCLGATATVLAARLARKGIHALDLGHIGLFMRHQGAYELTLRDLISKEHQARMVGHHAAGHFEPRGHLHLAEVLAYAEKLNPLTILDYGCGDMALAAAAKQHRRISGYDPGIVGREGQPKPGDLTTCINVLEYVEEDRLPQVIKHLQSIAYSGVYLVISLKPHRHVRTLVYDHTVWQDMLKNAGFRIDRWELRSDELFIWSTPK